MKKLSNFKIGFLTSGVSVLLLVALLWLREYSTSLIIWVQKDLLRVSTSFHTPIAVVLTVVYVALTCLACGLLPAGALCFAQEKPLGTCWRQLVRRYVGYFGLFPLLAVVNGWEILWPCLPAKYTYYHLPIPTIDPLLDLAYEHCQLILYLSVMLTTLSFITAAYNRFKASPVLLNSLFAVLWLVYAYSVAYILPPYFEYGMWLLAVVGVTYLVAVWFLLPGKKKRR